MSVQENIVHASDSVETAAAELKRFSHKMRSLTTHFISRPLFTRMKSCSYTIMINNLQRIIIIKSQLNGK